MFTGGTWKESWWVEQCIHKSGISAGKPYFAFHLDGDCLKTRPQLLQHLGLESAAEAAAAAAEDTTAGRPGKRRAPFGRRIRRKPKQARVEDRASCHKDPHSAHDPDHDGPAQQLRVTNHPPVRPPSCAPQFLLECFSLRSSVPS